MPEQSKPEVKSLLSRIKESKLKAEGNFEESKKREKLEKAGAAFNPATVESTAAILQDAFGEEEARVIINSYRLVARLVQEKIQKEQRKG